MASKTVNTRMQQIRKTTEQWITTMENRQPLLFGEIGFDYSNEYFRVGDGSTLWNDLPYYSTVPIGTIIITGAPEYAPAGFLYCGGASYSRTTYSGLFSKIKTTYGSGDGSTTFNVPNLKERFPKGFKSGWFSDDITGGSATVTLTPAQMPTHNHIFRINVQHGDGAITSEESLISGIQQGGRRRYQNTTDNTGGGVSHNNMSPFTSVMYYIKY